MADLDRFIRAVERELRFRHNVYGRLVATKRMTQAEADVQIAVMRDLLAYLREQKDS